MTDGDAIKDEIQSQTGGNQTAQDMTSTGTNKPKPMPKTTRAKIRMGDRKKGQHHSRKTSARGIQEPPAGQP